MFKDLKIRHIGMVTDVIAGTVGLPRAKLGLEAGRVTYLSPDAVAWAVCGEVPIELLEYLEPNTNTGGWDLRKQ